MAQNEIAVDKFDVTGQINVRSLYLTSLCGFEFEGNSFILVQFKPQLFHLQDDLDGVFLNSWYGRKLVINTSDLHRDHRSSRERTQKYATHRVTNSSAIAGITRLDYKDSTVVRAFFYFDCWKV